MAKQETVHDIVFKVYDLKFSSKEQKDNDPQSNNQSNK